MLVFVKGHGVGAVLVVVDAIFPFLAELEELAERPLHHDVFAATCADAGDVTLCIYNQHLWMKRKRVI